VVSGYDVGDVGPRLSDRAPCAGSDACSKKGTTRSLADSDELIPLTVPEVCRRIWWLVWRKVPTHEQVVSWLLWRRKHQAQAKHAHYKRTAAQQTQLQL
jgi:hypothetical protein